MGLYGGILRIGILGDTGSGKTVLAIDILREYHTFGYINWCNIPLINIENNLVKGTDFIEKVDAKKKNTVLIDEVGEVSRGINQFNFGQLMAQSRKSIGEDQLFIMTSQVSQQTSTTMKGMIDFIVYPQILSREFGTKKPIIIRADFYKKMQRTATPRFYLHSKQYRDVHSSCDYYDTNVLVDALQDGRFKKYIKEYEKYIDSEGEIKNLKLILQEKHGLNLAESERMSRKIINARKWELID